jgi:RNA polymerase sigma-70 factor, ECF subfamily
MNSNDQTDERLLEDFAKGNHAALGELAHRYEPLMLGLACGMLGRDQSLACDAVQDAWVRVIRHAGSFRGESTVKTWLYRITLNCCKDLLGSARRRGAALGGSLNTAAEPLAGRSDSDERRARLNDALMTLPLDTRSLLLLCYQQGMTHANAAEVLRIPVGTLKSRLHAALAELRQRLEIEVSP